MVHGGREDSEARELGELMDSDNEMDADLIHCVLSLLKLNGLLNPLIWYCGKWMKSRTTWEFLVTVLRNNLEHFL